ncbi:hypothetical protein O181_019709 [Austropuccinia psidii MF-1]|uniref:Integrase catalytic domain-containing protein n=1 Tax=Austropuccinia psidii MF-1 TaxID=1389203 RepID=A0A9Q3GV03_9BASI|nr:hypothetical protein [Austropuccinia psidii MF-1]
MDLPSLSFHASLEEQWDEEEEPEEIETVMKVFPPSYHQYLDVLSKRKVEKLPPHCACDHHIELKGLLPAEALSQFHILKEASITAPILSHFNPSLQTIVETDASDYSLGALLSQMNDSGKDPIAFDIFTDHSSLQYFISSKVLTCFQACWAEVPSQFHFTITYCPGRLATLPDALSCRDNVYPERGVYLISKTPQKFHPVIKQTEIQHSRLFSIKEEMFSEVVDQIQKEVCQYKYYKEVLKKLGRGESVTDYSLEPQSKLLLFKYKVVIPRNKELQLDIPQKHHDSPLAGHPGQEKALKLLKRDSYLAGMNQIINDYVYSCQKCSRKKNICHKKFELLKCLQIPSGPWNSLSMDFITELLLSKISDSILVVVDIFSKMAIVIPTFSTINSLDLAQSFISHLFSKHGLPVSIDSDRGSSFISSFWTQLCQKLKISRDLATSFHAETDAQTERVNQTLEQYIWINEKQSSTKQSPFFTVYGRNPRFDYIHIYEDTPSGNLSQEL